LKELTEYFALNDNDLPIGVFPMRHSNIMKYQQRDKKLLKQFRSSKDLKFKEFHMSSEIYKQICDEQCFISKRMNDFQYRYLHQT